jgi:hypothetical protein
MKALTVLILLAFSVNVMSQVNDQKILYLQKVEKFRKMKSAGIGMLVVGSILTVAGFSKATKAEWTTNPTTGQSTTNDPDGALGVLMATGGIMIAGGGVPLAIIGSKKQRQYERKLEAVTINLNLSPQRQGLVLTYKF